MDYHEATKRFAFGGYTGCTDLKRHNAAVPGNLPLIMSYTPDSAGVISDPEWGYTLALSNWRF